MLKYTICECRLNPIVFLCFLLSWKCTDEEISTYLSHPNTRAVFTTQHQNYDFQPEKMHSIPLGVQYLMKNAILSHIGQPQQQRTQLLMINDNGWRHRSDIAFSVMANFNYSLVNTYDTKSGYGNYLKELRRSKFILAPSGFGWDCYRIWDALYMGTIPIIERYNRPVDGWRRSLEDLPVLWVECFEDVTPELLNEKYLEIASKEYNYEKLTTTWWIDFIRSFVPEDSEEARQQRINAKTEEEQKPPPTTVRRSGGPPVTSYDEGEREIPRILHFVYVSQGLPSEQSIIPLEAKQNIDGWQNLHPNWKVILWDNAAVRHEFPELMNVLEQINTMSWISNLIRYHALERYGGIYIDVDVVPLQSIDRLRRSLHHFSVCEKPASEHLLTTSDDYLISNCELVNNAIIGAPKNHPALKDVIANAMANTEEELANNPGGRYKLATSGPPVWTESAMRHSFNILHPSLFFPCSWSNKSDCQKERFLDQPHVYGMHKWKMTWYNPSASASNVH